MTTKKNLFLISFSVLLLVFLANNSVIKQPILALQLNNNSNCTLNSYDWYTWKWSPPEVVSTESTQTSLYPESCIDSKGNIHVAWCDDTDYDSADPHSDIFYKRWDASSSSWTTTEVVSTESNGPGPNGSYSPSLGVDSYGNIHIAWLDETDYAGASIDFDVFYKRWDALTSSWTTTELLSQNSNAYSYELSLAIDSSDNVHIAWRDDTSYLGCGTDPDIFYRRWNSTTSLWITTQVVSTESDLPSRTPSLAIDSSNNVHIAWWDYSDISGADQDIFYKKLEASTLVWPSTTDVISTESSSTSKVPHLSIDSLDNIHVVWCDSTDYDNSSTELDIFYKRWNVLSSTWSLTNVVSTESTGSSNQPFVASDSSGNVHVVWQDYTDYSGSDTDSDIFHKCLDVPSSSWTITEVVTTESIGVSRDPSLVSDPSGTLHLFWEDSDISHKILSGPPTAPNLAFIVPNPDEDGSVYIEWNDMYGVDLYYVYRSTSYIYSTEELVPLTSTSNSYIVDSLPSPGFYYYVIVAENYVGKSEQSNCQYIEYKVPALREFAITMGILGGAAVILIAITNLRKKKQKSSI